MKKQKKSFAWRCLEEGYDAYKIGDIDVIKLEIIELEKDIAKLKENIAEKEEQ